jgi:hypothetical protein
MFDEIGSRHPATADAIKMLVDAKVLTPDDALEQDVRTAYGLPTADPGTARQNTPPPVAPPAIDGQGDQQNA